MAIRRRVPQFVLEKWIHDRTVGRVSGARTQEIAIIRGHDNLVTITGVPLTIAFEEMFLRQAGLPESDIVIPVEALERIAHDTWIEQAGNLTGYLFFSAKLEVAFTLSCLG